MRGIHSVVDDLRRQVFTEVARLAYEGGDFSRIDALPYKIIPGEDAQYRHDVFLERAIVTERLRLACGLPPAHRLRSQPRLRRHRGGRKA